jgi:hypothetical protein
VPTLIDSLVVALGLDASGFTKGQKDASVALKKTNDEATRTAKELELRGKQAGEFFSQIKNQALGMLAVFTAGKGLSSFVSDVVAGDAAVGRMATNIGMSTEDLSAWQGVAERAGGSAAGMSGSLKAMAQQMAQISISGTPGAQVLQSLAMGGINISKYFDKATTSSQRMLMAADAFKGMDAARAQALGAGMGFDEGTVNVLMQGRQAVQALLTEQEKIGHTNEADAKSAEQLQAAWRALGQASGDLGRKILTSLSPYIQQLSAGLLKLSEWASSHRPMVEGMFIGLAATIAVFAAVLAAPVAGIAALAAGIGIAVGAIAALYEDWKTWTEGGQSAFGGFWQFFADKWASVSGLVTPVFASLKALFLDWATSVQDLLKLVVALFTGNGDDIRKAWNALVGDLGKYFSDFVGLIKNLGPAITAALTQAFSSAFDWIEGRAHAVWDAITGKHTEKAKPGSPEDKQQERDAAADTELARIKASPGEAKSDAQIAKLRSDLTQLSITEDKFGDKTKVMLDARNEALARLGASPDAAGGTAASSAAVGKSIADSAFGALISKGEGDYNSVNRGAAHGYKAGTENLAGMTINEVMAAQKAGDFKAAGRYQVMPENLTAAVKALGLSGNEKFDKGTQDKVFDQYLLNNKRKAIGDYVHGQSNDLGAAMLAASKEWASVADPRTGKSYYDGKGNNKSSITPEQLRASLEASRNSYLSGAGAQVAANKANSGAANHTTTSDVKIAQINVHTQATDAKGIAKDIGPAVKQYAFAVNANTGLS